MSTVSSIVLEPSDISVESVQRVFEASYIATGIDDNGHLNISDAGLTYTVRPDEDGHDIIFFVVFGMKRDASEDTRLATATAINVKYKMVRAAVHRDDDDDSEPPILVVDYLLCTA